MNITKIAQTLEMEGSVTLYVNNIYITIEEEIDYHSIAIYKCRVKIRDNSTLNNNCIFLDYACAETTDAKYAVKWALDLAKEYSKDRQ